MADKQKASLIIKANLECEKCCKKIQKVLNKLKGKEKIINIVYENSDNRVIISGHFKPEELAHKLRCKACGVIKDIEFGKLAEAKKEEKKPDQAKKEEKKQPEEKKPEEKKKSEEEKKKGDEKKPEEGKKEEKKEEKPKVKEETKATPAPSSTTVNLQFTNMCGICYPWPCSDPTHWGAGVVHPQWPQCEAPAAALPAFVPGHHHHQLPPWGGVPAPKWPCGGPSYCGGCGTCRGGGWPAAAPMQAMCCPGPSSCRGCKGCRIVQEGKFVYEEYPAASACAVM